MEAATTRTARMTKRIFIGAGVRDQGSELRGSEVGGRGQIPGLKIETWGTRVGALSRLAAYDEDDKAAGEDWWTGARIFWRWVGAGADLCRDEVDAVGGGVVGHGAGAALGGQIFDCGVGCGAGIDDGDSARSAARGKGEFVGGVPASSVGAVADSGIRQRLACVGVGDGHVLAVAD